MAIYDLKCGCPDHVANEQVALENPDHPAWNDGVLGTLELSDRDPTTVDLGQLYCPCCARCCGMS